METMETSEFLFIPARNGEWLRDSRGKPRVYKSGQSALRNLADREFDTIQMFECIDEFSKECCEYLFK